MTVEVNEVALQETLQEVAVAALERAAYAVENTAKVLCSTPGTGGEYLPGVKFFRRGSKVYRWKRTTAHRASAPGQPPAPDTGLLRATISHTAPESDGEGLVVRVGTDVFYGLYLELGTRYMKPRPFLRPALDSLGAPVMPG